MCTKRKLSWSLFPFENPGVQLQKMAHQREEVYAMNGRCMTKSSIVERKRI